MHVMRQTACLVVNPITINNFADLFNCTPVGRASDLMMASALSFQLSWLGPDLSLVGPTGVQLLDFCCSGMSWFAVEYSSCFISVVNLDLYVRCFDSLMSRNPSRGSNNFCVYMNHNRT